MKGPRAWFRFENKATDPTVAEIYITDVIGSWDDDWFARNFGLDMGVTARAFVEALAQLPDITATLKVHINSPGGDIQAGVNIANALREQGMSKGRTVETYVDGIAASIASVIAMAGSKVYIADNALVMIHNPWAATVGSAADMRKTADVLDTMRNQIVNTYKWHSSLDDAALAELMDAETWMDADQAIANGFATDKVTGIQAAASLQRGALAALKVPDKFKARVDALLKPIDPEPKAATAIEVLDACNAYPEEARALIAKGATLDQVKAHVQSVTTAKAAAQARANDITTLCAANKQPELAAGYINGGMALADVKAHLVTITAKLDKAEIDAGLNPDAGVAAAAAGWKQAVARVNQAHGRPGQGARH